jgi:transposase
MRTAIPGVLDSSSAPRVVRSDRLGGAGPSGPGGSVSSCIYDHHDPDLALTFVGRLGADLQDDWCPPEVRQLGRTIGRWRHQIAAWHQAHVSNGPPEAVNDLIKRVKRVAFGFRRFAHYRIRTLLYAGEPNWDLLATITAR